MARPHRALLLWWRPGPWRGLDAGSEGPLWGWGPPQRKSRSSGSHSLQPGEENGGSELVGLSTVSQCWTVKWVIVTDTINKKLCKCQRYCSKHQMQFSRLNFPQMTSNVRSSKAERRQLMNYSHRRQLTRAREWSHRGFGVNNSAVTLYVVTVGYLKWYLDVCRGWMLGWRVSCEAGTDIHEVLMLRHCWWDARCSQSWKDSWELRHWSDCILVCLFDIV